MYILIKENGIASPAKVLIAIGALSKEDYERWRFGKVDCLERVCKINLRKLSFVNHEIHAYAHKHGLKPSWTYYKQWGANKKSSEGKAVMLRFSKSGNEGIEKQYATHYVGQQKVAEAKERREVKQDKATPDSKGLATDSLTAYTAICYNQSETEGLESESYSNNH